MKYIFFILVLIFISGCSLGTNSLSTSDKNTYQNVLNEINYNKNYGDFAYKKGFYKEAFESYKIVNFYENRKVFSKKYLDKLDVQANSSSKYHYKKALSFIKKDKIKALYFLNKMVSNNPNGKEKRVFEDLKRDSKVKEFLAKKEENLKNNLSKSKDFEKSIVDLKNAFNDLFKYDSQNNLIKEAKETIKYRYNNLLSEAIILHTQGNYHKSKVFLKPLHRIYPNHSMVNRYLDSIYLDDDIKRARTFVKYKKYNEALITAKKILKKFPNNKEALNIITSCKAYDTQNVDSLIKDGVTFYHHQDFEMAKRMFIKILQLEPKNKLAHTYLKKIGQRLKTIKNLR